MAPDAVPAPAPTPAPARPGLHKLAPYWYPYTTMAKGRWLDREILEIISTEFRDRSIEYYRYALESGVTTINGKLAKPGTIVRNGDRIENVVHRHEPPVTSRPVKILHEDRESEFIVVDKPGSIPVHATGRYFYLSLVEILQREFGYQKVYTVNRLDRLTSGLMIINLSSSRTHVLSQEFVQGEVKKEYIARCSGEFPAEEVVVDQPLLTVDRQMGLNIVHPDGKVCTSPFEAPLHDAHQIRVHLQYLGYPIANDPRGIDTTPPDDRAPPVAPAHLVGTDTADLTLVAPQSDPGVEASVHPPPQFLPRETGKDIGMGSPVPLSAEAVGVITRLRSMKDEDWSRWRDVVFKGKGRLHPTGMPAQKLPPQNRRKRGGPAWVDAENPTDTPPDEQQQQSAPLTEEDALAILDPASPPAENPLLRVAPPPDAPTESGRAKQAAAQITVQEENDGALFCGECYLPLHPDPSMERLYIFLHALRYTTSLGVFETEMPE
ncbi:pseudouridine synthase [Lactarius sanguifluus]|nr:pseudouridine synthase [Lactarius sanguifluus]